jgi:hypothetical protein
MVLRALKGEALLKVCNIFLSLIFIYINNVYVHTVLRKMTENVPLVPRHMEMCLQALGHRVLENPQDYM